MHAQVWYTERNHIKVLECGCIACSVIEENAGLKTSIDARHELLSTVTRERDQLRARPGGCDRAALREASPLLPKQLYPWQEH